MNAFILLLTVAVAWAANQDVKPPSLPDSPWVHQMKEIHHNFDSLLPLVLRDSDELSSGESKRLHENLGKLLESSKSLLRLAETKQNPDRDPSAVIYAELFEQAVTRASSGAKMGHIRYMQGAVRALPAFCIACHTRNPVGPSFSDERLPSGFEKSSAIVQADAFLATRRYAAAEKNYFAVLEEASSPFLWQKAYQSLLTLAVRVRNDPLLAEKVILTAQNSKKKPLFMTESLRSAREQVAQWKAEIASPKKSRSTSGLALVKSAQAKQNFLRDRSSDVLYLRAMAKMSQELASASTGGKQAELFFGLGESYQALDGYQLWSLAEPHWEKCIKMAPVSRIAQKCYDRLEEATYAAFVGTIGGELPKSVESDLLRLQTEAYGVEPLHE